MNDSNIEILTANGYLTDANGSQILCAAQHGMVSFSPGTPGIRDAVANIAVLEFTVEMPTALSTAFAAALIEALTPTRKLLYAQQPAPLIRQTANSVRALYQTNSVPRLYEPGDAGYHALFQHGVTFPDARSPYETVQLWAHCSAVFIEGGEWLASRSPLNTPRATLPTWDGESIARTLRTLVDRLAQGGEIRERGPYVPPAPPRSQFTHSGEITDDKPTRAPFNDPRIEAAFHTPVYPPGHWLDGDDEGGEAGTSGWGRQRG
jgi:hypothetical protein